METDVVAEQQVLKKIRKRLQKVIRTYEKVVARLEKQLDKINRLEDEPAGSTVKQIIVLGINQSRRLLEKARQDHTNILAKQADYKALHRLAASSPNATLRWLPRSGSRISPQTGW